MSVSSPCLGLPFIQPSQAQKHVTHNEALQILDALVQAVVQDVNVGTPPAEPNEGDCYALADEPSGDWTGYGGQIAIFVNGGWIFAEPKEGWRVYSLASSALMVFEAGGWHPMDADTNQLDGLGIQTDWDPTNRLSVVSAASLFSHQGSDHRVKVNKAGAVDTASLLFQSNWTGHAEMGLAGDEAFSIKVSADGSTWHTALTADAASQKITLGLPVDGPAIQQSADDTTVGRLMRADYGYCPGNILGAVSQVGGQPQGAVVERGSNANGEYVRFADGTQVCTHIFDLTYDSGNRCVYNWTYPKAFAAGSNPVGFATIDNEYQGGAPASSLAGPWCRGTNSNSAAIRIHSPGAFTSTSVYSARAAVFGRWF